MYLTNTEPLRFRKWSRCNKSHTCKSYSVESFSNPKMFFLQFIVIVGIFLYNTQNNTIFATKNENRHTWFSQGPNEAFSHFIQHKNHVLDVEKISSFLVGFVTECALECVRHLLCLSFNIKEDTTENSTKMTCELLPVDLFNVSLKFQKRGEFHHWSIVVSRI